MTNFRGLIDCWLASISTIRQKPQHTGPRNPTLSPIAPCSNCTDALARADRPINLPFKAERELINPTENAEELPIPLFDGKSPT